MIAPGATRRRRLNRDALLTLEIHRVHLGADFIFAFHLRTADDDDDDERSINARSDTARGRSDLVNFVDSAGVVQDAFAERRFARIDVR